MKKSTQDQRARKLPLIIENVRQLTLKQLEGALGGFPTGDVPTGPPCESLRGC